VDGVPVLAHPLEGDGSLRLLPELVTAGLTGLEAYYTGYTPEQVHLLEETAHHYHLLTTGGSDYHGGGVMTEAVIGQPPVPYRVVVDLRMRHVQSIVG
jgi:predicted metal-dependent phosphoesterase TrpH